MRTHANLYLLVDTGSNKPAPVVMVFITYVWNSSINMQAQLSWKFSTFQAGPLVEPLKPLETFNLVAIL